MRRRRISTALTGIDAVDPKKREGNKRVALVCAIEFCQRNVAIWNPPSGDEDSEVTARVMWDLAAYPAGEKEIASLATWIAQRIAQPEPSSASAARASSADALAKCPLPTKLGG
ncbi:MAG: hypothetical protein DLM54_09810 [Acidimicrobiales bacterium]|nr:MAG: hypothetical protein DLM54_09810 [Acidimicrobiales bacterium]